MRNNYISGKTRVVWFAELKKKYPSLWNYEKKNSKPNGKDRNILLSKVSGKYG